MKETDSKTAEWEKYRHFFKRKEIASKTILLSEGEIARNAFLIEKGCIRVWFNNHGKDVTFQFFFEGEGVSSIESFRTGLPSLFNIESIEQCVIQVISKKDLETIIDSSVIIKKQIEEVLFERLILYQKLFLSRIKDSPEKRYHDLLEKNPRIIQRVPQHYIASYLGITPVSLSRIRNRK